MGAWHGVSRWAHCLPDAYLPQVMHHQSPFVWIMVCEASALVVAVLVCVGCVGVGLVGRALTNLAI